METANILLALGGDVGNTVPKFGVTASEIAVLRVVHGDDAVKEVEPTGRIKATHKEERERLRHTYGKQVEGRFVAGAVEMLFPGAAARVFETIAELDLPEEFFKAEKRVSATLPPEELFEDETPPEPKARKPREARRPVTQGPAPVAEDDGFRSINDEFSEKGVLG